MISLLSYNSYCTSVFISIFTGVCFSLHYTWREQRTTCANTSTSAPLNIIHVQQSNRQVLLKGRKRCTIIQKQVCTRSTPKLLGSTIRINGKLCEFFQQMVLRRIFGHLQRVDQDQFFRPVFLPRDHWKEKLLGRSLQIA